MKKLRKFIVLLSAAIFLSLTSCDITTDSQSAEYLNNMKCPVTVIAKSQSKNVNIRNLKINKKIFDV